MKRVDTIFLGFGQNLILGHKPHNLDLGKVADKISKEKQSMDSYGFFDTAQPNFNTYYPDVKEADFKPKDDEDYIFPTFRALSEVIVRKQSYPADFTKNSVLKDSKELLLGQTVYPNHEALVGNDIGVVFEVEWQESYKAKNNIKVPAGFNAVLKIDGKSHPKIARGILSDPPSIHSTSVSVTFEWEKSHSKMDDNEFFSKMGTFDHKGQLIRRIATNIVAYHELSLVPHGADSFAQKIGVDGKIVNPRHAKVKDEKFSQNDLPRAYFFSFKHDLSSLNLNDDTNHNNNTHSEKNSNTMDFEKLLNDSLKKHFETLKDVEITEDNLEETLKGLKDDFSKAQTEITSLTDKNKELETQLSTKDTEIAKLKKEAGTDKLEDNPTYKLGKETLENTRKEATRLYNLVKGDKAKESFISLLNNCDYESLEAHIESFNDQADDEFKASCQDCGSENITRRSSKHNGEGGEGEGDNKDKSHEDVLKDITKDHVKTSSKDIHGEYATKKN